MHDFTLREVDNLVKNPLAYLSISIVYLFKRGFRSADRAFALFAKRNAP
jgi:hypothetical protein